jgi:uncharacterized protein DUF4325
MATVMRLISIAKEFSETPGPRAREEGEHSGSAFLEDILRPAFVQAIRENSTLTIDLDGTEGYATSFLESAFGGLAREFGPDKVLKVIGFKSDDEPYLIREITRYIEDALKA